MRRLRVLEFHTFVSDLDLKSSSSCGRMVAAFIAPLEFGVSSTNDSSCWFTNSMIWKPGLFLLKTMKRGLELTTFSYMSYILI